MAEKKSLVEEALLSMKNLEEVVAENAKGILASTMKQEISELVKESLKKETDEQEEDETGVEMDMDNMGDDEDMDVDMDVDMDDMGDDEGGIEDRVMDLEDALDELKAEFDALMAGEEAEEHDHPGIHDMGGDDMGSDGDDFGPEEGGDAIEMDDTEEMDEPGMMEAVTLKAAPKPVTSEPAGTNTKSNVAANAGAKGPIGSTVKPVHTTGETAQGHCRQETGGRLLPALEIPRSQTARLR